MDDLTNNSELKSKGFAKAFKIDIGREKEIAAEKWEVTGGRSLLMNPIRQKIFKYLCQYPCSSLSTIAHDLKLSIATMSWHLNLLVNRKIISEKKERGQRIFYPTNIIDPPNIPVLSLLANLKIHDLFIKIRDSPGITQKLLAEEIGMSHQSINNYTNRLGDVNLINIVKDGKFTRYYPTKKLESLEITQRKKLKEFRKWIIKIFKHDGVNPKLIKVTDKLLYLQITSGTVVEVIELSVNPFNSIVHNKKRFLSDL
jgi:DNA-binding transcriptional ArsR family regulator